MPNPNSNVDKTCPECHVGNLVVKSGRYGNFTACSNYPNCKYIEKKTPQVAEITDQLCDKCGKPLLKRNGQFGPFLACSGFPQCKNTKKVA